MALLEQIKRCNNWKTFKQIHAHIITTAQIHNPSLSDQIIDYFTKYVALVDYASDYLTHHHPSNPFPFNSLISGYARTNVPKTALFAFRSTLARGFVPDPFTFTAVLKSCARFLGAGEGMQVHGGLIRIVSPSEVVTMSTLLHFYGSLSDHDSARKVFDEMPRRDSVTWTCMISVYAKAGLSDEALELFLAMEDRWDTPCFVSALAACGRRGYLNLGRAIHGTIFKSFFKTPLVLDNAMVDMYVKCGSVSEAWRAFNELGEKDVVSWNIMISGLLRSQLPKESLEFFREMGRSGIEPDEAIFTSVLSACASLGALDLGKWVHDQVDRTVGIERDVQVETALVDMYSKCGCIETATKIFDKMPSRNIVTWNALLNGLAFHGHGHKAIERFEEMEKIGIKPNGVTFLAILTACSHSGLVKEGRGFFHRITSPRLEHYGCMVDLFCRAGLLDEAREFVKTMPIEPDALIWGSLLSACIAVGDTDLSREISDRVLEIESRDSGAYVLLSNVYARNENWVDVTRLRGVMKKRGIKKSPGSSVVEIDGEAHEFLVGDMNHARNEEICQLLTLLSNQVSS